MGVFRVDAHNLTTMDPESLMFIFETRMQKLLKDPKNFEHFTDEQMDMIENTILPSMQEILNIKSEEVHAGHA